MAHGYLMHSIQSPISNKRNDAMAAMPPDGASFLLEVAQAVKAGHAAGIAVGARITGSDWVEGGLTSTTASRWRAGCATLGLVLRLRLVGRRLDAAENPGRTRVPGPSRARRSKAAPASLPALSA